MAQIILNAEKEPLLPQGFSDLVRRRITEISGLALIACGAALLAVLLSYDPGDPSLNNATDVVSRNLLGTHGAYVADLMLQGFGLAGALPVLALLAWGWKLTQKQKPPLIWIRLAMLATAMITLAMSLSYLPSPESWPLISGLGGISGNILMENANVIAQNHNITYIWVIPLIFGVISFGALIVTLGFSWHEWRIGASRVANIFHPLWRLFTRKLNKTWSDKKTWAKNNGATDAIMEDNLKHANKSSRRSGLVSPKLLKTKAGKQAKARSQGSLKLTLGDEYQLPPLELLESPPASPGTNATSNESLQQNALLLEAVLKDFGVHGEIIKVRPGPVVTLYELEPAPGTRTSRIIGLSDDIARSMSAVSVRVAVIPGRNAIGIELPNIAREMVYLRELVASKDLECSQGKLNLALGKDISGTPILVDLARMPHLLIAGTTGSGKSVAINTMILSILCQLRPDECKFIMIDPKMLELSAYEGIPHLLTPVVTDPSKAVVALKWAVREMEERYRAMSQLGVRNITSYNNRLAEARKKNETLTRRVQTGFDEQGKPVFEEQPLSTDALPFIVIVVDEMADLMLIAGKDIEGAVQRLAQMARAAGIHVIMATQRPSVDVITGTIKANFPTRISFQVTSKIDSRTILGEQGAEQLLGQGDMLYMAGGGRVTRIHGPFVSDIEVQSMVNYLKSQGTPCYIEEVTENDDFNPDATDARQSQDTMYDEAVALIAREGKASTSFIQRHLQIGYNRAARIIERMETENIVSKANRVGRREVLIPTALDNGL